MRAVTTQLQAEGAKPEAERDATKIQNLQLVAASTQGEYRRVVEQIKATHQNYEKQLTIKPAELSKTQRSIPPGVVFVQYAPLDDQLYIFLVTKDSLKIYTPPVKPDDLWKHIKAVRRQIVDPGDNQGRGAKIRATVPADADAVPLDDHLNALCTTC